MSDLSEDHVDVSAIVDPDLFAALLCDWCLEVREGQQVLVSTTTLAEPLAAALSRAMLARGVWPHLRLEPPRQTAEYLKNAQEWQLDSYPSLSEAELQHVDSTLRVMAPADPNPMAGIDPAIATRASLARQPLQQLAASKRWSLSLWPTAALAEVAQMPLAQYAGFVQRALLLDQPDPLAAWKALRERQARVVDRLTGSERIRIQSDRTDITLDVSGRVWVNSDGKRNMPSGEVFTSPLEDSANGTVFFDVPSNGRGTPVSGVRVEFRQGRVVSAHAEQGDEALQAALATDEGARGLGELGIGTNTGIDRATGSTLLDEKIAGTVHLALGRSYPECGGQNESALHWDMICDLRTGGTVTVDGEVLISDGRMLI